MAEPVVEAQTVPFRSRLAVAAELAALTRTVIEPPSGWRFINLRELWQYRELLYFFAWRDVKIRYKQTLLGATWAVIQPLLMMVVFTVFLGRMGKFDSGNFPYPVFVYAGLLPWTFFASAISQAGNSVVQAQNIITKIYFPRLIIPFSSVGAALVDFAMAFGVLLCLMLYYGIRPGWSILLVLPLLFLTMLASLGAGSLLAALNVAYRDFRYTIPFLVQLWMFATPTIYTNLDAAPRPAASTQTAPAQQTSQASAGTSAAAPSNATGSAARSSSLRPLMYLNPMTGVIGFFRAATLGGKLPWTKLGYSAAVIAMLLLAGVMYFRRVETRFADIV